jgi:heme/copper-type cytochrome/quinol oxidase subunit 2
MDAPANTMGYMLAGYGVIFGLMILYLVSMVVRYRNLRQDQQTLEQIEQDNP